MNFIKRLQKAEGYIEQHWKVFLAAVFALQMLIIIINFSIYGILIEPDTASYVAPALSLLRSGKMLDGGGYPILLRTPGYPLLLALIYGCFGQNDLAVIIIQKIMILAITWMIFSGVSQFTNRAVGVLASWFYVVDFVIYSSSSSILTDTPFSFFVMLAVYALLRHLKTQKMAWLILCCAAVNFALLVRPNIMYLNIILFFVLLLLSLFKKIPWKKTLPYILLFLAAYGGWCLRNAAWYGKPVYSTVQECNVFQPFATLAYAQEEGCSKEAAIQVLKKELARKYPDFDSLGRLEQAAAYNDVGMPYIKAHISGFIKVSLIGLFKEMFGPNAYYIEHLPVPGIFRVILLAVVSGMLTFCYLIYAAGFFANIRKWNWLDWLLLFSTLYLMATTATLGYSRFRVAFYPICVVGTFLCWRSRLRPVEDPV